jgi:hypothetical protein
MAQLSAEHVDTEKNQWRLVWVFNENYNKKKRYSKIRVELTIGTPFETYAYWPSIKKAFARGAVLIFDDRLVNCRHITEIIRLPQKKQKREVRETKDFDEFYDEETGERSVGI